MSKKKIITYIVLVLIGIGFIGDCVNRRQRNKLYRERVEELEQNFNDVKFAKGKADLTREAQLVLCDLAKFMESHSGLKLKLEGHTSEEGDETFNQRLSEARAQAAVDFLISQGVSAERLEAEGKGSRDPIDLDSLEVNRRTEFVVIE